MKLVTIKNDRAVSVREYKNTTANTTKTLDFRQFSDDRGLVFGSPEHRAEFSRYCNAENVKGVASLEKFRASGLVLEKIVETTSKADGSLKTGVIRFSIPKVAKEKVKKQDNMLKAISELPEDALNKVLEILKQNNQPAIEA
jgi:hypothetical protein